MKKLLALLLAAVLMTACAPASAATFLAVGSTVTFGSYEQDGNYNNGSEPIQWIVLDVRGSSALLLSRYVLDAQPWNTSAVTVQWYTCTLSSWMNYTFYNSAFSYSEQNSIDTMTTDPVFLLSDTEVRQYVGRRDLAAVPTRYALRNGVYSDPSTGLTWWWTRSVGNRENEAMGVNSSGVLTSFHMRKDSGGIRPAVWVNLSALN